MVGLPIGFFSPLPLAMMIPFMATQSLAMGEAFGKSYQYGKRKISAMSNDEFNKYSMSSMMDEQTINYKMMIPKLHEMMEASQQMQQDIFQEMLKIIPTFLEAVVKAVGSTGNYQNTLPGFGDIPDPGDNIVLATQEDTPTDLTLLSHGDTITTPDPPSKTVSTPDLSVYNNFSLQQLKDLNAQGVLKSYIDTLIKNREETRPDTDKDIYTQTYIAREISIIKNIIEYKSRWTDARRNKSSTANTWAHKMNQFKSQLQKFYLSYRGTAGIKLTPSWRNHNAQMISQRAWAKY